MEGRGRKGRVKRMVGGIKRMKTRTRRSKKSGRVEVRKTMRGRNKGKERKVKT